MKKAIQFLCTLFFIFTTFCAVTFAEEFTPYGAIIAGNETGEIPPYEGIKDLTCPDGYEKGDFLPNPYVAEKVILKIDHTNVDKHKDRLMPGQIARLKKFKNRYMNIYPTHRNMEWLDEFYAAVEKNKKTAKLDENKVLHGHHGSVPFPLPKNGFQAIWNVKRQSRGDDYYADNCERDVSPRGKVKKRKSRVKIMGFGKRVLLPEVSNPDKVSSKLFATYTYPPDDKGLAGLQVMYLDDTKQDDTWMYTPALRRVRRVPSLDQGFGAGEATVDESGYCFRGLVNKWNWKLIRRMEKYVPANNYEIYKVNATDEEECHSGGVNPALIRYELHRVWIIEGTRVEGYEHPYQKRVIVCDEDHWFPILGDSYDTRGNLWRTSEFYNNANYCEKILNLIGHMHLNLESGRYQLSGGCRDKKTKSATSNVGLKATEFTIQALRRAGR